MVDYYDNGQKTYENLEVKEKNILKNLINPVLNLDLRLYDGVEKMVYIVKMVLIFKHGIQIEQFI